MEHDLNILMIFGIKEKWIILTHIMYCCLLLQIYLCCLWLLLCSRVAHLCSYTYHITPLYIFTVATFSKSDSGWSLNHGNLRAIWQARFLQSFLQRSTCCTSAIKRAIGNMFEVFRVQERALSCWFTITHPTTFIFVPQPPSLFPVPMLNVST